jgi:hypothetical protein
MRFVLLALVLIACAAPNAAIQHARTISAQAACTPIVTDAPRPVNAKPGDAPPPDTAICDIGRVLVYCWSGEGAGADCLGFADFRPRQQPSAPPASAEPKPDASKADETKPDPPPPTPEPTK